MSGDRECVAGFLICPERNRVILIQKNRPAWQRGYLNAIGGKIEDGETPAEAMRREYREETGLDLDGWALMLTLRWAGPTVHFFRLLAPIETLQSVQSATDELVLSLDIDAVAAGDYAVIQNVRWLVKLAAHTHDLYAPFDLCEVPAHV